MGRVLFMRKGDAHTAPRQGLPTGYTKLAYIQANGTQLINSEIPFSADNYNKVKLSVEMDSANKSGAYEVNGTGTSGSNCFYIGNYNGTVVYGHGTNDASTGKTHQTGRCKYTIDAKNGIVSADGMTDVSFTPQSPTGSVNLYVCGFGRTNGTATGFSGKFYAAQIWIDDILVRDFIPCINPSGTVGLYDLVGKKFYGNNGTGTFGAGDVVEYQLPDGYEELAYIQSSGTQYVNTEYIPNQNTRVVAEMEYVSHSNATCSLFGSGIAAHGEAFETFYLSGNYYFGFGSANYTAKANVTTGKKMLIDLAKDRAVYDIGGTVLNLTPTASQTFTGQYELLIHAMHRGGSKQYLSVSRTYSFKIYDNGACVRWYVPVVSPSGSIGLYDVITRAFYGNAGTGAFTGSEVA